MRFNEILEEIKLGKKASRHEWKGFFIVYQDDRFMFFIKSCDTFHYLNDDLVIPCWLPLTSNLDDLKPKSLLEILPELRHGGLFRKPEWHTSFIELANSELVYNYLATFDYLLTPLDLMAEDWRVIE